VKIRNPHLIKMLGWLGARVVRGWIGTLRCRVHSVREELRPERPILAQRFIYVFWHEYILVPACLFARPEIHVLISEHADGQLIANVSRNLGFSVVSGSSTRGGIRALKQMVKVCRQGHIAITPDGPQGPRRHLQPGLVYLASRAQLPVVPMGIGLDRPWRARSWDRFVLPRPCSRAVCVFDQPILVPVDLTSAQLEEYRRSIEEALQQATARAEQWAATGRLAPALAGQEASRSRPSAA
jgi:lysophospholipid acyltransferase (LPLAT)-like uncharacterized protein